MGSVPLSDGELMVELLTVPAHMVDRAWRDGAHMLSASVATSGGEITADQLKLILSRGERTLIQMRRDGEVTGWGVICVDQMPNARILYVTSLYAPGAAFHEFFTALKQMAEAHGCSRIRCSAQPVQARLYQMKCGFKPVYQVLEVEV